MVIERVGPTPEAKTHTERLGRVLVTIDDLQALLDLLSAPERLLGGPVPKLTTLAVAHDDDCSGDHDARKHSRHIEFDGGYFTDPSELPKLTDDEVRSLRINTPVVQIILSPTSAVAIGEERVARTVYQTWARSRQTEERRPNQRPRSRLGTKFLLTALILSLAVASVALGNQIATATSEIVIGLSVAGMTTTGFLVVFLLWAFSLTFQETFALNSQSYAVIVPYSLDDYRRNKLMNKYPRVQTIVAIVSTAVAVLAIAATFVVAYYKP